MGIRFASDHWLEKSHWETKTASFIYDSFWWFCRTWNARLEQIECGGCCDSYKTFEDSQCYLLISIPWHEFLRASSHFNFLFPSRQCISWSKAYWHFSLSLSQTLVVTTHLNVFLPFPVRRLAHTLFEFKEFGAIQLSHQLHHIVYIFL